MNERGQQLKTKWHNFRTSEKYHKFMIFLMFLIISSVFWIIITLNDNAQDDFNVELKIKNIPGNVTFINDAPITIHVNVRDKVGSLLREGLLKKPIINIDFNQYASKGTLRLTNNDLNAALRSVFGNSAQFTSVSIDSLRLEYTTYPGKKVKLKLNAELTPSLGKTISGEVTTAPQYVTIYSTSQILDTIKFVTTEKIIKRNINETTNFQAKINPINGVKIIPDKVTINVPVEPLVLKKEMVEILPKNVPTNERLMLFPSKAEVSFFVPMSKFNEPVGDIILQADYNNISKSTSTKLNIKVVSYPEEYINIKSTIDSVEYTVVKIMQE